MSQVGLRYPREYAKIRGVRRRQLVAITRNFSDTREPNYLVHMGGKRSAEYLRQRRQESKQAGEWHDHWSKRSRTIARG